MLRFSPVNSVSFGLHPLRARYAIVVGLLLAALSVTTADARDNTAYSTTVCSKLSIVGARRLVPGVQVFRSVSDSSYTLPLQRADCNAAVRTQQLDPIRIIVYPRSLAVNETSIVASFLKVFSLPDTIRQSGVGLKASWVETDCTFECGLTVLSKGYLTTVIVGSFGPNTPHTVTKESVISFTKEVVRALGDR